MIALIIISVLAIASLATAFVFLKRSGIVCYKEEVIPQSITLDTKNYNEEEKA